MGLFVVSQEGLLLDRVGEISVVVGGLYTLRSLIKSDVGNLTGSTVVHFVSTR